MLGTGVTVCYIVTSAMMPDVIEADYLRTGRRREGVFAGMFTIFSKISTTVAVSCSSLLLEKAGYVAPVSSCGGDDAAIEGPDTQPEAVLTMIRWLLGPIPAVFFMGGIFFTFLVPLTPESYKEVAEQAP